MRLNLGKLGKEKIPSWADTVITKLSTTNQGVNTK